MLQAIIFDFDGVLADTEMLHLRAFQEVFREQGVELRAADYYARYVGLDDYDVLRSVARDCGLVLCDTRLASMLEDKAARYARLIATTPVVYDGVEQRVREWSHEVPLAIASGALRTEIEAILRRNDLLSCFAAIVTAKDVARGKPAPDAFLAALERLQAARHGKADALPYRGGGPPADIGPRGSTSSPRPDSAGSPARQPRRGAHVEGRTSDSGRQGGPIESRRTVAIEDSPPGIEAARAAGMRTIGVTTNCAAGQLEADLVVPSVAALDLPTLERLVSASPSERR